MYLHEIPKVYHALLSYLCLEYAKQQSTKAVKENLDIGEGIVGGPSPIFFFKRN